MVEKKYGKYITRGPKPDETKEFFKNHIGHMDDARIPGSFHFVFTFIFPSEDPRKYHGPHTHPVPELLGYFGTDPNNPFDLGAEMEIYLGEEMEKNVFNQSSLIYIPPGLVHAPIIKRRQDKPYIFIYTMPIGKVSETPRKDVVPESLKDLMMWPTH